MLLALLATPAPAAELSRVFLSPAERAALTASRPAGRPLPSGVDSAAASPPGTAPVTTVPRATRVEGVTFGVGRNQAVWIGGRRVADGGYWSGQRVRVLRVGMEVRP